jgi:uncharacterized phage protein (TIGR02220 family)
MRSVGLQALILAWRVDPLSMIERATLAAIASHADEAGHAWPGEELLAAETSLTSRSVRTAVRGLEMRGIVKVTRRGRQLPNAYAIKLDTLEAMPTVKAKVTGTTDHLTGTTFRSREPERPETDDRLTGTSFQSDRNVLPKVTGTTFLRTAHRATAQRTAEYKNGADAPAHAWLALLNQRAGTSFRETDANLRPIRARLRDGHTFEEAARVVAAKTAEWQGRPDFAKYLRPLTLFGPKFDSYLQSASNGHRPRRDSWDGAAEGRL